MVIFKITSERMPNKISTFQINRKQPMKNKYQEMKKTKIVPSPREIYQTITF